jgi:hypothetical protein
MGPWLDVVGVQLDQGFDAHDGVSSSPPTSPTSTSRCSPSTVRATRWCPKNTVDLDRRLPNSQLVLYPDAGHGGVFQFHEDFVKWALEFL